ncbi:MAG: hypothetical protein ACI35V_10870 [Sphingobacterium composti]|uniref:hypothetical protein n=1 Tax=Sphingobacterium composti TaxID=363260 RepID=UPI00135A14CF|nr:hypothetical protein [Sphingobacterium composti Ten et al. 2007 non Yoo et al. 2007]
MKVYEENKTEIVFRYLLVGNIIDEHFYGENKDIKSGTKHFRAGAKVYLIPEYGGMGHEKIPVIGLPRKNRKKIEVLIDSKMIKNVRVKKTYNSKLIEKIKENHFYSYFNKHENELEILNDFAISINENNKEILKNIV